MVYNPYVANQFNQQNEIMQLEKMRDDIDNRIRMFSGNQNVQNSSQLQCFMIQRFDDVKAMKVDKPTMFMDENEPMFYMKQPNGSISCFQFNPIPEPMDEKDKRIVELINENKSLRQDVNDIKKMLEEVNKNGKSTNGINQRNEKR